MFEEPEVTVPVTFTARPTASVSGMTVPPLMDRPSAELLVDVPPPTVKVCSVTT